MYGILVIVCSAGVVSRLFERQEEMTVSEDKWVK